MDKKYISASDLRKEARIALRGRWLFMVFITAFVFIVTGITTNLGSSLSTPMNILEPNLPYSYGLYLYNNPDLVRLVEMRELGNGLIGLGLLISVFITGPLLYGLTRNELALSRNISFRFGNLFDGFKNGAIYSRSVGLSLFTTFFVFLWFLGPIAIIFPLIIMLSVPRIVFFMFWLVVPIVSVALGIRARLRYSMALMIMVDNPHMTVRQTVNTSKAMMKEKVLNLLFLRLSFIGWYILLGVVVSVPIGLLGYIFYNELIDNPTAMFLLISKPNFSIAIFLFNLVFLYVSSFLTSYIRNAEIAFYRFHGEDLIEKVDFKKEEWLNVGLTPEVKKNCENEIAESSFEDKATQGENREESEKTSDESYTPEQPEENKPKEDMKLYHIEEK